MVLTNSGWFKMLSESSISVIHFPGGIFTSMFCCIQLHSDNQCLCVRVALATQFCSKWTAKQNILVMCSGGSFHGSSIKMKQWPEEFRQDRSQSGHCLVTLK